MGKFLVMKYNSSISGIGLPLTTVQKLFSERILCALFATLSRNLLFVDIEVSFSNLQQSNSQFCLKYLQLISKLVDLMAQFLKIILDKYLCSSKFNTSVSLRIALLMKKIISSFTNNFEIFLININTISISLNLDTSSESSSGYIKIYFDLYSASP